jgi:signal transduction histidine kinase/ligand-binding sensor domain-containing protein/DNA-binding response OmpR family regulator
MVAADPGLRMAARAPLARLVVLIVVLPGSAAAQDERGADGALRASWVHESWSVEDGLPVNSFNQLLQSRDGYIWGATFDGLVRFDGVRFTVFNTSNSDGLPNNRIVGLHEARDSSLWLLTERGELVRFRHGRFLHYGPSRGITGTVLHVIEAGDSALWIHTASDIGRIEADGYVSALGAPAHDSIYDVLPRRDGRVWLRTARRGLHHIVERRVEPLVTGTDLDSGSIQSLLELPSGAAYVSSSAGAWIEDGVWRSVHGRGQPVRDVWNLVHAAAAQLTLGIGADGVVRIEADSAAPMALDYRGGVLTVDAQGSLWFARGSVLHRNTDIVYDVVRPGVAVAPTDRVTAILIDREGSIWISMAESGLHRIKPALFTTLSEPEGLSNRNVLALYEDAAGAIWVSGRVHGPSRIDPDGTITRFGGSDGAPEGITSWIADGPSQLLLSTFASIYTCTLPALSCTRERSPRVTDSAKFALHRDAEGRIWAGTSRGLAVREGGRWSALPGWSGSAPVRAFASTRDGALWMGTNGDGVLRWYEGRFTQVNEAHGLPSNLVRSLYADAAGMLWIGTEGRGLARLDPLAWADSGDRRIARIGAAHGLFDDVIHQILEDNDGRLWMSSNRGIFWVARNELNAVADGRAQRVHSTSYTEGDGIRNREANGGFQPAGIRSRDGRLWFATQDGVVFVDPREVGGERPLPPVIIERVIAGDTSFLPYDAPLHLDVTQRDLQLEFTALSLLEPFNNRFRYRLDPYDDDWVDAGNRRTAFYTRVPPGRYTFRVIASNREGVWNQDGARLALTLAPYFWETATFRTAMLLLLLITAVAFASVWQIRVQRRALELERIVSERTSTLRERERQLEQQAVQLKELGRAKSRFFANVSHEFRTPLTLAIGPLEDIRARLRDDADPTTARGIDMALRNSRRLLRLVNQILDVARLEAGHLKLRRRPLDVVVLVRGLAAAFSAIVEQREITLVVDTPESLRGAFDADAIEKILTNLLSNAIKFTPARGRVTITLSDAGEAIRIEVSDTGPGIPAHDLPHVFERFYQADESATRAEPGTGIGLALARELVELHGGTISVASGADGTTFTVALPHGEADAEAEAIVVPAVIPAESGAADEAPVAIAVDAGEDAPSLLIVDDSTDLRSYVREHFGTRFRVHEAADGQQGLEVAMRELPDVILCDVMMPMLNGHEVCRRLRADPETDFLPIILLTAQAAPEQRIAGLERGADDFIVKPFEMRELEARVDNLIALRRRLRERFAHERAARTVPAASPAPAEAGLSESDRSFVERVRAAIEANFADPEFGVAELARAVFQDRSHLFRRTRQLMGESPSDLIRGARIEHAAQLLAANAGSVTDIAYAVGFNSVSYFCRIFQEARGATPAVYRAGMLKR